MAARFATQATGLDLLPAGVVAALIAGAFLLWNGWRQRRHEIRRDEGQTARAELDARRGRLGPELRSLMQVGEELEAVTVRLTHDPAREVQFAPESLTGMRGRLDGVLEPELLQLRQQLHTAITEVTQWRAVRKGIDEDLAAGSPVDWRRHKRVERFENEQRGRVRKLTDQARAMLADM
jgi:hypothetical protein